MGIYHFWEVIKLAGFMQLHDPVGLFNWHHQFNEK